MNKLNRYGQFVIQKLRIDFHDSNEQVCLIPREKQYYDADERYTDFSTVLKHKPNVEPQWPFPEKKCEQYYFAVDDDHKTVYLDKISEWQAYYIRIYNFIKYMGEKINFTGTEDELYSDYAYWMLGCRQIGAEERKKIEEENLLYVKNHQMLLSKESGNWFRAAPREAKLKSVYGNYIAVEIDSNVLVFNAERKYDFEQSSVDLSKYCLGKVRYWTIKGDKENFAYAGFIFDNVTYKITNYAYSSMYSYIATGHNDISMIPKDLIKFAREIKFDISTSPEVKFCQDAVVECNNEYIKITHGPIIIYTYFEFDCLSKSVYTPDKHKYIKSQMVIGKFNDELYVFLKIGAVLFKCSAINVDTASKILIHKRIN